MSWDLFVQDLPPNISSVDDIPGDFRPKPLGPRSEIIAKILEVVPSADFSDPSWGDIDGADWSIEVNLGTSEECDSFALHVRGYEGAVPVVLKILDHLGLRAIDPGSDSGLFDSARALESFSNWRTYADNRVKFDVFGRFKIEVAREQDQWVAYRLDLGKRIRLPELAIPPMLEPSEIAGYLDDLYHEMASPGQVVREIQ